MQNIKTLEKIKVNLTPYTVTYSSDGNLLAYGEGFYYGCGNIVCVKPGTGIKAKLFDNSKLESLNEDNTFTVSGLCFDSTNQYLATSAWQSSHCYYPAMIHKLNEDQIIQVESFDDVEPSQEHYDLEYRGYATGVAIVEGKIAIRRSCCVEHTITVHSPQSEFKCNQYSNHLASRRLAVLSDKLVTGCHRPRVTTQEFHGSTMQFIHFGDGRESISSNLLFKSIDGIEDSQIVGVPHVVSAICANADGSEMITGGADGSIILWKYRNPLKLKLIDEEILDKKELIPACQKNSCLDSPGHTYDGNSIVAVCYLNDSQYWASAEASGHLKVWHEDKILCDWHSDSGSPRSIAANPVNKHLAVAFKSMQSSKGKQGIVEIFDLTQIY